MPTREDLKLPSFSKKSWSLRQFAAQSLCLTGAMVLWGGVAGCYEVGAGRADLNCMPGQLGCVCDAGQGCEPGLSCQLDRCLDTLDSSQSEIPEGPGPDQEPDANSTFPDPSTSDDNPGKDSASGDAPDSSQEESPMDCQDGKKNANESDVDCGGKDCQACENGKACQVASDCKSQNCQDQLCRPKGFECDKDAQCEDQNPCTQDRCVATKCEHKPVANGSKCDDKSSCTIDDRCDMGSCTGRSLIVLDEDFDGEVQLLDWYFGSDDLAERDRTSWSLGKALRSDCGSEGGFGEDPAQDHSPGAGNGIVGVDIGGCHTHGRAPKWDCAWTAFVNVSAFDRDILVSFWRHLHAPGWTQEARPSGVRHRIVFRYRGDPDEQILESMEDSAGYNDTQWKRQSYRIPRNSSEDRQEISVGICYQRSRRVARFAGWSIDDVLVRPIGCLESR